MENPFKRGVDQLEHKKMLAHNLATPLFDSKTQLVGIVAGLEHADTVSPVALREQLQNVLSGLERSWVILDELKQ